MTSFFNFACPCCQEPIGIPIPDSDRIITEQVVHDNCGALLTIRRFLKVHVNPPPIVEGEKEDMNFEKAKRHFYKIKGQYLELVGMPGVNTSLELTITFFPLEKRYNNGERSQELFDAMMAVE